MTNKLRKPLVLVTPHRVAVDRFIASNYPGVRIDDVIWISNSSQLNRVKGLELDFDRVHFLHESYLIDNAKQEIMSRVRNNSMTPDTTHAETEWEKEFDKNFYHDDATEYYEGCKSVNFGDKGNIIIKVEDCDCQLKDIKDFIREQISLAHQAGKAEEQARTRRAYCVVCQTSIDVDTGERE
jgi:hypothetical protein